MSVLQNIYITRKTYELFGIAQYYFRYTVCIYLFDSQLHSHRNLPGKSSRKNKRYEFQRKQT